LIDGCFLAWESILFIQKFCTKVSKYSASPIKVALNLNCSQLKIISMRAKFIIKENFVLTISKIEGSIFSFGNDQPNSQIKQPQLKVTQSPYKCALEPDVLRSLDASQAFFIK
jgi:hypothetical protein